MMQTTDPFQRNYPALFNRLHLSLPINSSVPGSKQLSEHIQEETPSIHCREIAGIGSDPLWLVGNLRPRAPPVYL